MNPDPYQLPQTAGDLPDARIRWRDLRKAVPGGAVLLLVFAALVVVWLWAA